MLDLLRALLEREPLLTLFLVIGLGYLLGAVEVKGVSLGVGAVLFVGLAVGAFAPGAAPPPLVQSIGLVLFLYGIGIQYGRQFVAALPSPTGRRETGLALLGVLAGVGVTVAWVLWAGMPIGEAVGLFAGALTSTPTLQAALDATGSDAPSIGYAAAYPLGVLLPILCLSGASAMLRPRYDPPADTALRLTELDVQSPAVADQPLGAALARLPADVHVAAVRRDGVERPPLTDEHLQLGDSVLLVGNAAGIDGARRVLGAESTPAQAADDRRDYLRVYVSRAEVIGRSLADLRLPETLHATVVNVRRGDAELIPTPGVVLESGDRIGVLTDPANFPTVRAFFGGSVKGAAEVNYISLGLGMVLGVALGLVEIPLPVIGGFSLGLAGGTLVMALILGWVGRTGRLTWTIPLTANLALRTFGLTLFLAVVGMRSGEDFVQAMGANGVQYLVAGASIVLVVVLVTLLVGLTLLRVRFDELVGVVSGVTGNPAILNFATRLAPPERVEVGYAVVFPGATIMKILAVQLMVAILGGTGGQ